MNSHHNQNAPFHLCNCSGQSPAIPPISRRGFIGTIGGAAALGGIAMISSKTYAAAKTSTPQNDLHLGTAIRVKPILVYNLPQRKEMTSWRMYGGIQTQNDVNSEVKRIESELTALSAKAEFKIKTLPLMQISSEKQVAELKNTDCDVILIYAAGGMPNLMNKIVACDKPKIMFLRHKSGPFYFWYEVAHFWLMRKLTDTVIEKNIDIDDIVVDSYDEILWRLRSLYGLTNAMGTKVLAIAGLQSYTQTGTQLGPPHAKNVWNFEVIQITPQQLGEKLKQARNNDKIVREAQRQTDELLAEKNVTLDTGKEFVFNSFITLHVFKEMMAETGATNVGVAHCMGKLIPITQTPPCLVLSLLNDEGYTAFCHVDFTHTPPGVLLRYISSKPTFLCNTHLPHDGIMTLAHCSAPRKMNGKDNEPMKIMTHYESDFGAAPKVMYSKGQEISVVMPNFSCTKWQGFKGTIIDSPSYPACRTQINMTIDGDWRKLLEEMQGFHVVTCYGDYLHEVGYALKKLGIDWQNFTRKT